jgi:hypothetical protein
MFSARQPGPQFEYRPSLQAYILGFPQLGTEKTIIQQIPTPDFVEQTYCIQPSKCGRIQFQCLYFIAFSAQLGALALVISFDIPQSSPQRLVNRTRNFFPP